MATVLVVDDDANVRLTLALALRRFGHEVAVAPDAEAAFEVLHERQFEWVVSDVRMPGMSGVEFATLLCDYCDAPRVVLTSAYSDVATPGSVIAFFQKPVDARQLSEFLNCPVPGASSTYPAPQNTPPAGSVNVDDVDDNASLLRPSLLAQRCEAAKASHFNWTCHADINQAINDAVDAVAVRRGQSNGPPGERQTSNFIL